jgi:hypothetical protein
MVSSHFSGSNLFGKSPQPDMRGMPFRRWVSGPPPLFRSCRPLLNADGKVAYWAIYILVLLIILSGAVLWFRGGTIADRQFQSVVALDRDEVRHIPHRYRIERPAKAPLKPVAEVSPETGISAAPKDPSADSREMAADRVEPSEKSGATDQQTAPPPHVTGEQPPEAVPGEESIAGRKHPDTKIQETVGARPGEAAPVPDAPKKVAAETTQEGGSSSPPAEGVSGKRFFVQTDVANVRDQPSMKSKILFQTRSGCSVTVTDQREGWYAVSTDGGRSGWVYHTLLGDSLVPREDRPQAIREIKAIRVEPPLNQTGKVVFELSAPYVPEIVMMDGERPRIVCDFPTADVAVGVGDRMDVHNGVIETIRVGLHRQPQFKVRVVLDLAPGRRYEARQAGLEHEDSFALEIEAVGDP